MLLYSVLLPCSPEVHSHVSLYHMAPAFATGVWTVNHHHGHGMSLMLTSLSHLAITMTHLQSLRYIIFTLVSMHVF